MKVWEDKSYIVPQEWDLISSIVNLEEWRGLCSCQDHRWDEQKCPWANATAFVPKCPSHCRSCTNFSHCLLGLGGSTVRNVRESSLFTVKFIQMRGHGILWSSVPSPPAPQITPALPTLLLTPVFHAACHSQHGPAVSLLPSGHEDLYSILFIVELFPSRQIQKLWVFIVCLSLPVQFSCSGGSESAQHYFWVCTSCA